MEGPRPAVAAVVTGPSGSSRPLRPDTLAVRGGVDRSGFFETAEAMFLTSGFVYDSAAEAEAAFAGDVDRFVYSRYGNPTVATFQERLRLIEGADACFATATGMAAVFTALAALVEAGDRVVAARSLFGSCFVILDELLPRWGVQTEFVDGADLAQWEKALATPAKAVFFESPSNPMQELVDVRAVCDLAHAAGAQVVVDNVFATPCCSGRSSWVPTSWSTPRPSTSTAKVACWAERSSGLRSSSTALCRTSCGTPARP